MTPRGPAALIAAATSPGDRGISTCAVVGAVRPQPRRLVEEVGVLDIANEVTRPPLPPLSRSWFCRTVPTTRLRLSVPVVDPLDRRARRHRGSAAGDRVATRRARRGPRQRRATAGAAGRRRSVACPGCRSRSPSRPTSPCSLALHHRAAPAAHHRHGRVDLQRLLPVRLVDPLAAVVARARRGPALHHLPALPARA